MKVRNSSSKFLPVIVIFSIGLLSGCDAALKKAAETYIEVVHGSSFRKYDNDKNCTNTLNTLAKVAESAKKAQAGNPTQITLLDSEKENELLITLVAEYQKKLESVGKPTTAIEKLYPQNDSKKLFEQQDEINTAFLENAENNFPKIMKICKETSDSYLKLCHKQYKDNIQAELSCNDYYRAHSYLKIVQSLANYTKISSEEDRKKIQDTLNETFEDNAKKQVAAQEAKEAEEKKKN